MELMGSDSSWRLRLFSGGEAEDGEESGGVGRRAEVPFVRIDRSGADGLT